MAERPWYKRYGADFVHGTLGLSLEEKGAYSLCLDLIYDRGGPIPDDARWLAGVCGCSIRKWRAIRERLLGCGKLHLLGGALSNARAEREIEFSSKISRKYAENGSKGGNKRAENERAFKVFNGLEKARLNHRARVPDARRDIEEPNGSLSETSSDVGENRGKRIKYPPDFEAFWGAYPTDKLMSKKKAFAAFKALDTSARNEAIASLPAFKAYCRSKPDYRPVHAVRYITEERYLGFQELAELNASKVFVAKGSPEWEAWQRVRPTQAVLSSEHRCEGWWFESEFPPISAASR